MGEVLYRAYNGHQPTTGQEAPVTSGTALKTMLQFLTPSTTALTIIEWGWSCTGSPAGAVVDMGTSVAIAATVTAYAAADLYHYNFTGATGAPASSLTVGTTSSGFTSTAEGTIAAWTAFDTQQLTTNTYVKQFPLGREPVVPPSTIFRIRNTVPTTAVNVICYVIWHE